MPSLDENNRSVVALYDAMFNQHRPDEAIERFADEEYRQDNLHVGDIEFGLHGDGVAATWAASSGPAATGVAAKLPTTAATGRSLTPTPATSVGPSVWSARPERPVR